MTQRVVSFITRAWNVSRRMCDSIFYRLAFCIACAQRGRIAVALVIPQDVLPMYTIWKTCMLLGLRIRRSSEQTADVAVYWEDTTISSPPDDLPELLNARCTDISKDVVEERFAQVFGYPLAIDEATHEGPYVRKSRYNFAHNGMISNGPVRRRDAHSVYERLVDNTVDDGWQVMDMRTAIVGGQIPVVFLLYRSITDRFGTDSRHGLVVAPQSVFSELERRKIVELAQAMGLDFGELDILRDASDGRIYVVDVNKTPVGPPRPLMLGDRHRAMRLIADAFATEFLGHMR